MVDEHERHLPKFLEDPIGIGARIIDMGDNAPISKVDGEDGKEISIEIPSPRPGIRGVEMVDQGEETRLETQLETPHLRTLEIMELDM